MPVTVTCPVFYQDHSVRYPLKEILKNIVYDNHISEHGLKCLSERINSLVSLSTQDKDALKNVFSKQYIYSGHQVSESEAASYVKLIEHGLLVEAVMDNKHVLLCSEKGALIHSILMSAGV